MSQKAKKLPKHVFQVSIIIVNKVGPHYETPNIKVHHTKGMPLASPTNIRPAWYVLSGINTWNFCNSDEEKKF
jgi:hypothetical protein